MKKVFGTDCNIELRGGAKGIFDVTLGQELLFSKHEQGRFPEPSEIISLLQQKGFQ